MKQYQQTTSTLRESRPENREQRDPLLESAVQRVNQLTALVEAQARQLRRLESQLSELQRYVASTKR